MNSDSHWVLPEDHPRALNDAIGTVAINSSYLEMALENAINSMVMFHGDVTSGGPSLGDLIIRLDKELKGSPYSQREDFNEWAELRSRMRHLKDERDHIIHAGSWLSLEGDAKLTAFRRNSNANKRSRRLSVSQIRRTAIELKNAAADVLNLIWNLEAAETGMPRQPKRNGDVY
ncbi:hypothetical protein ACFV4N_32520 [Actinosynnema sp. NPDC059797]